MSIRFWIACAVLAVVILIIEMKISFFSAIKRQIQQMGRRMRVNARLAKRSLLRRTRRTKKEANDGNAGLPMLLGMGILGALWTLALLLFIFIPPQEILGSSWNWGAFVFYFSLLWLFLSLRVVRENQIGARILLGNPLDNVDSGLKVVPWPFFRLELRPKTAIQLEIPGEPDEVWKGNDENLPPGKVPPVRIITADLEPALYFENKPLRGDETEEELIPSIPFSELSLEGQQEAYRNDPLQRRLVIEVSGFVRYRITDLCRFLQSIEDLPDAKRQIHDTVVQVWQLTIAKMTPAHANIHQDRINRLARIRVQKECGEKARTGEPEGSRASRAWGIEILDVSLKPFDLRHTVNTAIADANAAGFEKRQTITKAEGTKVQETLIGEGRAAAVAALGAEIRKDEASELAARLRTMEEVAKSTDLVVAPTGDLFGQALAVSEVVKKRGGTPDQGEAS